MKPSCCSCLPHIASSSGLLALVGLHQCSAPDTSAANSAQLKVARRVELLSTTARANARLFGKVAALTGATTHSIPHTVQGQWHHPGGSGLHHCQHLRRPPQPCSHSGDHDLRVGSVPWADECLMPIRNTWGTQRGFAGRASPKGLPPSWLHTLPKLCFSKWEDVSLPLRPQWHEVQCLLQAH